MDLNPYLHGGLIFIEVLLLVWLAKIIAGLVLRRNIDKDLITLDNPAVAIALSGYLLAVFIATSGLLFGPQHKLEDDLLNTALYGGISIAALLLSAIPWRIFFRISLDEDLFKEKNIGSGLVAFSIFIATGLIFKGTLTGEGGKILQIVIFFVLGQLALYITSLIYQLITPYDIYKEVHDNANIAAALGFAGAIIAMGIITNNAATGDFISWNENLKDFAIMLIPLLLFWPVRLLIVNGLMLSFGDVNKEIVKDKNIGAGILEAVTYIGIAIFTVHYLG